MKRAALWSALVIAVAAALLLVWEATRDRSDRDPIEPAGAAESPATSESGAPLAKARWLVRGRILDLSPTDHRRFRIEVTPVFLRVRSGRPAIYPGGEAGRFEADVTVLVGVNPPPEELQVVVNHPAFIPVQRRVKLTDGRQEGDALTVFSLEVRLRRAARVSGVVRDAGGKPLPGVDVALFRMKGGKPTQSCVRATRSDASGRFILQSALTSTCLVVADDPERQPACALAEPTLGAQGGGTVDLVLPAGVAVTGRVLRAGRPPQPWVRVRVEQFPAPAEAPLLLWRRGKSFAYLKYWNGSVVRQGSDARTDPEGHYRIAGLAPGACTVLVLDRNLDEDVPHTQQRIVQAPASNVDFTLGGVPYVFSVVAAGEALSWARLTFTGVTFNDRGILYGTALIGESHISLNLVAGKQYRIRASHPGCVTRETDLVARASDGPVEVVIRLQLAPESATLVGSITLPDGHSLEKTYCWFQRGIGHDRKVFGRIVKVREGRFEVPGIPPGRWLVRLRAGPQRNAGGYCMAAEREVDLPPRERVEARFVFALGGRIRLSALDRDGRFVMHRCRIRDAHGEILRVWLVARGNMSGSLRGTTGHGPAETDPPLLPGRYRVEFIDRKGEQIVKSLPVQVHAGCTTDVELVVAE